MPFNISSLPILENQKELPCFSLQTSKASTLGQFPYFKINFIICRGTLRCSYKNVLKICCKFVRPGLSTIEDEEDINNKQQALNTTEETHVQVYSKLYKKKQNQKTENKIRHGKL